MSRTSPERQQERSDWIERAESVSALEDAGFFATASPKKVGGHDLHPATQVEAFEQLASADVSGGWVAMIQAETPGAGHPHPRDGRLGCQPQGSL